MPLPQALVSAGGWVVVRSWFSPEVLSRGNIVSQFDKFDIDVQYSDE